MAEYGYNELIMEIVNNKKAFTEFCFDKNQSQNENAREVFLSACETIANIYIPY